jgi:hypothetical protein
MSMLGGILPSNFADIPHLDRARLKKGNRYAAQRGLLRDEMDRGEDLAITTDDRDVLAELLSVMRSRISHPARSAYSKFKSII